MVSWRRQQFILSIWLIQLTFLCRVLFRTALISQYLTATDLRIPWSEGFGIDSIFNLTLHPNCTFLLTSISQYSNFFQPPCIFYFCTAQSLNDKWYECQIGRTDGKQERNYCRSRVQPILFVFTVKREIWNQFDLQTYFASKWYISGHGILIKNVYNKSPPIASRSLQ